MDTRIYIITHKKFHVPDERGYAPLHVGRALSEDFGYPGDNAGDNISEKNKNYCELTGIYWIWKNISCDIVGICHYRRYFIKDQKLLSKEYIEETLQQYDAITLHSGVTPSENLWNHYGACHYEKDLKTVRDIIEEKYPEYLDAFDFSMHCNLMTLGNMIITRKEIFDQYCEWLFDILFEAERRIDISEYDDRQKRIFGFLSERLLRIWLLNQHLKIREEDLINVEENNQKKSFFIMAPVNVESGGPELSHQMCYTLNRLGYDAYMYYADGQQAEPIDAPAPARYEKYATSHVEDSRPVCKDNTVFIFNEGMTPYIPVIPSKKKVLWWMSVDNYIHNQGIIEPIDSICREIDLHLVQSHYARDYLLHTVGVPEEKILYVSDYIGDAYGQFILPSVYRQNIALYNPYKGYADLKPLIDRTTWLKWIPLINLSEEQVIVLMQSAKIYVDFGPHPGKDRIPREAASCGLCVITNKKGSAAYEQDVPIPEKYKFDNVPSQYDQIEALMHEICDHFDEHSADFDHYRAFIKGEKNLFEQAVKDFIDKI